MGSFVECDTALDRDGQKIHINDAPSGAQGYTCLSCGGPMAAYLKRRRNEPHFQHLPLFKGEEILCIWANESHRHKVAKQILQRLKRVKVPALYAIRPDGFEGSVPIIHAANTIEAADVLAERCIFEDSEGTVRFARELEFEQYPGHKELLVRPDIIFRNADQKPILFIEVCVTHSPDDQKLARLARLRIPTIEVQVPPSHFPSDIESLFTRTTENTTWLYHPDLYVYDPHTGGAAHARGRSGATTAHQRRVFEPGESVKCRTFQVEDAIRGVRKRLAGVDHANRRAGVEASSRELGAEENRLAEIYAADQAAFSAKRATISQEISAVEAAIRSANQAVSGEVQQRVDEKRSRFRAAEAALAADKAELAREEKSIRADLEARFRKATAQLAAEESELDAEEAELRAAEIQLQYRFREHDHLVQLEEGIRREEAELSQQETAARARQASVQRAREQQAEATGKTENGFAVAQLLEEQIATRLRQLAR
jgi:hypothetical protein